MLGESQFHADIEAQVIVENGEVREEGWTITFSLSADSTYEPSEEYTLTYELEEEEE